MHVTHFFEPSCFVIVYEGGGGGIVGGCAL